jgi:hypothetical protein
MSCWVRIESKKMCYREGMFDQHIEEEDVVIEE